MRTDRAHGASEFLAEQESVEPRGAVRPGDFEIIVTRPIVMRGLLALVAMGDMVIELIVLGYGHAWHENWHARNCVTRPAANLAEAAHVGQP